MTQAEKRYWKNWEIKMEQVKEDQASREAVSDEKYAEANHPWDRMDRHDVIDPMASDVIY